MCFRLIISQIFYSLGSSLFYGRIYHTKVVNSRRVLLCLFPKSVEQFQPNRGISLYLVLGRIEEEEKGYPICFLEAMSRLHFILVL